MVKLQLLHFCANAFFFCLTPLGGFDVEIDALKPAVVYSIQWEAEWTRDQILLQLRHRKWAVGIATALETQTIRMGGGLGYECMCDRRLLGRWAQGKGVFRGVQQTGKHTENKEDKGIGYMTGTGESLADNTHSHEQTYGGRRGHFGFHRPVILSCFVT